MRIEITRLDQELPFPVPQHSHDAGHDLHAREGALLAPAGDGRSYPLASPSRCPRVTPGRSSDAPGLPCATV
jgi:hypothetical protein